MKSLFPSSLVAVAGTLMLLLLPACDDPAPPKEKKTARPSKTKRARPMDKPMPGLSTKIEEFTGAHTRIVWAEHPRRASADTFANSDQLVLKGVDTRDGKGERMIQDGLDNYSRPILSTDGEVILFTDKEVKRKAGRRHYDPDIYRTDWDGSKPVRIAEGYAVDCWRDPATGVEWVYAARHFPASGATALEAHELVRFPLDDPARVEVVYDEGPISPDNIQLSRDGSRASGLFPWPHAGVFVRDETGRYHAKKLLTGCWPALAPDDSGVLWVFDGGHRGATFFTADKKNSWTVRFNEGPGMKGHEMYHPRWTNHPRLLVITGPYRPVKNASGNVINKGGASANVHLGRFSEKLDRVEAWLQISEDEVSESYPDAWIAGADEVRLTLFAQSTPAPSQEVAKAGWPVVTDNLVFLWHDRSAVNQIRDASGKLHNAPEVRSRGAARFGRVEEMLLDGGHFEVDMTGAAPLLQALQSRNEVTLDALLLPAAGGSAAPFRPLFRGPNLSVALDAQGHLLLAKDGAVMRSDKAVPVSPFHLNIVRHQAGFSAAINGAPVMLAPAPATVQAPAADAVILGGGWEGGMLDVALYQRGLSPAEVQKQASAQMTRLSQLPPAPPQVRVLARLVEASAMPTPEGIAPYTGALVACVYEVEKVISGKLEAKRILVKHWAMLDQKPLVGFPHGVGSVHELLLEREDDHPHLKGERVVDDTAAFDLEAWLDVAPPRVR